MCQNLPAFPWRGFWGPQIMFSGEDEVDMLGSGELLHVRLHIFGEAYRHLIFKIASVGKHVL